MVLCSLFLSFLSLSLSVSLSHTHSLPLSLSIPLPISFPFFRIPSLYLIYMEHPHVLFSPINYSPILFSRSLTHTSLHTVQLRDVQGHLYNLINVAVRFSEPQDEPIPDAKLRMELANVVRNMTSLRNGRVPSTIEVGEIKAQGK